MKNKLLVLMCVVFLVLPMVIAETETYKIKEETDLKFTCTLNNAIPTASATYNITVSYQNGSVFIDNKATTSQGNGAFNYTTNFTEVGLYKVQMFCIDGAYSFSDEGFYNITGNGKEAPDGIVIVLFSVLFLIIIGFALFQLILSIGHFASLDLDVVDLAKTMGLYFAVLGLYQLSLFYLGNLILENWLVLFIRIGAFTHIIFPLIGFLISITIGSLKKKKIEFGTNRIYRRSKIGR